MVECQLPKLDVVGSNPIARFPITHLPPTTYDCWFFVFMCQNPARRSFPGFHDHPGNNLGLTGCGLLIGFEEQPLPAARIPRDRHNANYVRPAPFETMVATPRPVSPSEIHVFQQFLALVGVEPDYQQNHGTKAVSSLRRIYSVRKKAPPFLTG